MSAQILRISLLDSRRDILLNIALMINLHDSPEKDGAKTFSLPIRPPKKRWAVLDDPEAQRALIEDISSWAERSMPQPAPPTLANSVAWREKYYEKKKLATAQTKR